MKAVKLTLQKDIIMKLVLLLKLSLYRCYQNTYLKTSVSLNRLYTKIHKRA